jgi:hypothetical protein
MLRILNSVLCVNLCNKKTRELTNKHYGLANFTFINITLVPFYKSLPDIPSGVFSNMCGFSNASASNFFNARKFGHTEIN